MWPLCHTLMVKAIIETRKLKTSQISLFLPNPATLHISITFFSLNWLCIWQLQASQVLLAIKNQCRKCKRHGFHPWVGNIPWRRVFQPIPIFLPGESHRQRSLVSYSPWGCIELDVTGSNLSRHAHISVPPFSLSWYQPSPDLMKKLGSTSY